MECPTLEEIKRIFLVPNYSHLMSEKIRHHYIKRYWESFGLKLQDNTLSKI